VYGAPLPPRPAAAAAAAAAAAQAQRLLSERDVVMLLHEKGALALPRLIKHFKEVLPSFGAEEKKYLQDIIKKVAKLDKRADGSYAVLKDTTMHEYGLRGP